MKLIELTQGKFAKVDDEDFEYLNQNKWLAMKDRNTFYAGRESKGKTIRMHREIFKDGLLRDHKDRDGLNNQRKNLRVATNSQNQSNRPSNGESGYKGVTWDKERNKWTVRIKANGTNKRIGRFNSKEDAAMAYDREITKYRGDFAYLNF